MSIHLETKLSHDRVSTLLSTSEVGFLITLTGREEQMRDENRKPMDLAIVLDISGSMLQSNKLSLCKDTLYFLTSEVLNENDFVVLVTFSVEAKTVFSGKMTAINKVKLQSLIRVLQPETATNLSEGLFKGIKELKDNGSAKISAICLLTDGLMNEGITNSKELLTSTEKLINGFPSSRTPPSIYTFGYGPDADSKFLSEIANTTGGAFYAMNVVENVVLSFATCIGGLLAVAAQNVVVTCEISGESEAEFSGFPLTKFKSQKFSSKKYYINMKDVYCGEKKDIGFKIHLPLIAKESLVEIRVTCTYFDIFYNKTQFESCHCLMVRAKDEGELQLGPGNIEVERQMLRIEAVQAMEQALYDAQYNLFQEAQL